MRVKAFRRLGDRNPLIAEDIQVLLVEADDGTAVMVGCQYEPVGAGLGSMTLAHAQEEDFNMVLRNLGFTQLTVCTSLGDMERSHSDLERLPLLVPSGR